MEISGIRLDITIGDLQVYRAPGWWIDSQRHYPLGRAGITLPDPEGDLYRTIAIGDAVTIRLGYRNQVPAEWTGTVTGRYPGATADQLEVVATDRSLPLATTRIMQSWENESPEAIVAWAIRQAGLAFGTISSPGVQLPRVSAANIPVWQLVQQLQHSCSQAFGLDMSGWALWMGKAGVNWGNHDEPGDVVTIATTDNLIDHRPQDWPRGLSLIEAFLLPDLSHSRRFRLQDDRRGIDALHRAVRVRHEGTPDRCRTYVWYGAEHG
ncbi:hypothetical protein [Geobacter sp. SVR]|uniref:hypothetical protein n=1 Tax=Geobacter sp. SVR TaxID=2495594 RepID=UPI00143F020F|nr:hypothetical protein [Geobacter sp. SVR]BCS55203.1 hypothetical protein GSVR_35110 [Geobacter sp. SVR]GCF86004.1 hypothetical protein GSbR_26040 [Geobacter sp. SVR]